MKTFISDLIPRLQNFSQKLDDLTLLTNQHWVLINEIENSKNVYIFQQNKSLLISSNGKVQRGKWEYLGNKSFLIDRGSDSFLFKHGFFDENVLALKVDGKDEYAFLVNENKFEGELNTAECIFEFLSEKYLYRFDNNSGKNFPKFERSVINQHVVKMCISLNDSRVLTIYSTSNIKDEYNKGDKVLIDENVPEDGNYHYGWTGCVTIENGVIRY